MLKIFQKLFHKTLFGSLTIPSLNISVPLYEGDDLQKIVDDRLSAVIFDYGRTRVIADHSRQANFHRLSDVKRDALAILFHDGRSEIYRCSESQIGHLLLSSGTKLRDADWNYIHGHNADLAIYTCIEKSSETIMDIRLTFWMKV